MSYRGKYTIETDNPIQPFTDVIINGEEYIKKKEIDELEQDIQSYVRITNEMANTEQYLRSELAVYRKMVSHAGNRNFIAILQEVSDVIGEIFENKSSYYYFKGVVCAEDDIYYLMNYIGESDGSYRHDIRKMLYLSCVGNLDSWEFTQVKKGWTTMQDKKIEQMFSNLGKRLQDSVDDASEKLKQYKKDLVAAMDETKSAIGETVDEVVDKVSASTNNDSIKTGDDRIAELEKRIAELEKNQK